MREVTLDVLAQQLRDALQGIEDEDAGPEDRSCTKIRELWIGPDVDSEMIRIYRTDGTWRIG